MRGFLCCVLALLPLGAQASKVKWFAEGAESVTISEAVDVPMYRGTATQWLPGVLVTIPPAAEGASAKEEFFEIGLEGGKNTVSEDFAKRMGWKVKHVKKTMFFQWPGAPMGSELKWAVAPTIIVGDVVFENVHFSVGKTGAQRLDLATFRELAVALLPSKGVVRMVPNNEADALLASVGTPLVGEWVPPVGPTHVHGVKTLGVSGRMRFPVLKNGETLYAVLRANEFSSLDSNVVDEESIQTVLGVRWSTLPLSLGGTILNSPFIVGNDGGLMDGELGIGYEQFMEVDVAIDPVTVRLAWNPISEPLWTDSSQKTLELARLAFEVAGKAPDEGENKTKKSEVPDEKWDKGEAKRHADLGSVLVSEGLRQAAQDSFVAAVASDGEDCAGQLNLGRELRLAGKLEDAVVSIKAAADLWDQWASQKLGTRVRVENKQSVNEGTFENKQNDDCFNAHGLLAETYLLQGDHDGVQKLYHEHGKLNGNLAYLYGLSLIQKGESEKANGPMRQALNLDNRANPEVRLGLGFLAARTSNAVVAKRQLDRILETNKRLGLADMLAARSLAAELDEAVATEFVESAVAQHPRSVAAWLTYGLHKHLAGEDTSSYAPQLSAAMSFEKSRFFGEGFDACDELAATTLMGGLKTIEDKWEPEGRYEISECYAAKRLVNLVVGTEALQVRDFAHPLSSLNVIAPVSKE